MKTYDPNCLDRFQPEPVVSTIQRYLYWHEGEPKPEKTPEGCEVYSITEWVADVEAHLDSWEMPRRWPVTEAVWRAHHYCNAYGISVPKGYEVVDFRRSSDDDHFLMSSGEICGARSCNKCPILRKIEPAKQYRTPTDEDAKNRPRVEVRQSDEHTWVTRTLVAVLPDDEFPYLAINGTSWKQCRMEVTK